MTVLQVPNTEAAIAYAIHKIVEKEGKFYSPSETHSRSYSHSLTHNVPLEMLMAIPGIGPKQASVILKSFSSMEKVLAASIADFQSLSGIGMKTATTLYESLR